MGILEGKVAIITGCTRGFGLAVARAYAREGAAVVIASRSPAAVQAAVDSLRAAGARASGWPCDVGDLAQVEALAASAVEAFGPFHVWVNNAGIAGPYGPTAHVPPDAFARVLQTNVFGVYHGSLVAMRHFVPRGSGKLINVLGQGSQRPRPLQNAYASSKAWIRHFTLALAKEYQDSGVGAFTLHPGLMQTDLTCKIEAVSGYEARLRPFETVIRMWAKSPDVPARKAVWLASPATDGRTGLEVKVSTTGHLLRGAVREAWRRLTRRPAPPVDLTVETVPAALPKPPVGGADTS